MNKYKKTLRSIDGLEKVVADRTAHDRSGYEYVTASPWPITNGFSELNPARPACIRRKYEFYEIEQDGDTQNWIYKEVVDLSAQEARQQNAELQSRVCKLESKVEELEGLPGWDRYLRLAEWWKRVRG